MSGGGCPICGLEVPLEHELQVIWLTAPWERGNDPAHQERHVRWLPVCEACASQAALFRVDYPRALRHQQQRATKLVLVFGVTLFMLLLVLFGGRNLTHSDQAFIKLIYGAGWFAIGLGTIFLLQLAGRVLAFELAGKKEWAGPWLERRLRTALQLPMGEDAPYWWHIDLTQGLLSRRRPPPGPVSLLITPRDYGM